MKNNLEHAKKLLIVVDLVNGFVTKGNMADPYIQRVVPESQRLVEQFLNENNPVMYIKDCHKNNCTEYLRYPVHCQENTFESQMVKELFPYEDKVIVIRKNSTSAIFAEGFVETINEMKGLDEIVIIGCCTDICVINLAIPLQNYFDEHNKNVKIIIPKNAVETYASPAHPRDEYNNIAFKLLAQTGIKLINNY